MKPRGLAHALLALAALQFGCITPKNYHPGDKSRQTIQYPKNDGYFCQASFDEAYIEFDEKGHWFEKGQLDRAAARIKESSSGDLTLMIFIHGWKNNAAETSNNVWGFRRLLDHQAAKMPNTRIMGVYLGWPGDAATFGKLLTFANREAVAKTVGDGNVEETLETLLKAAKGNDYAGKANTIVIGHSFGGLVLERAMLKLFNGLLDNLGNRRVSPPADLTILLNEAAPAAQAKDFLARLLKEDIQYSTPDGAQYPLILSITSDGDVATKLAFPGGAFLQAPKKTTFPPDIFGQTSSLPYDLQTAANFDALRSHAVKELNPGDPCAGILIPSIHKHDFCVAKIDGARNKTPYWISGLPQVFVPDHGQIFREEVITLVSAFLAHRALMPAAKVTQSAKGCAPLNPLEESAAATAVQAVAPPAAPTLNRRKPQ